MNEKVVSVVEKLHLSEQQYGQDGLLWENRKLREEINTLRRSLGDLERSADMDPLVPVYNRRGFMRELNRAISVQDRFDIQSSVIFMDLNGFKAINDHYGHMAGDELLIKVGKCLKDNVRATDLVARLGGDEFGLILFKTCLEEANLRAVDLASQIEQVKISFRTSDVSVSTAFGAAPVRRGRTAEQILAEADEAMYDSKLASRLQNKLNLAG